MHRLTVERGQGCRYPSMAPGLSPCVALVVPLQADIIGHRHLSSFCAGDWCTSSCSQCKDWLGSGCDRERVLSAVQEFSPSSSAALEHHMIHCRCQQSTVLGGQGTAMAFCSILHLRQVTDLSSVSGGPQFSQRKEVTRPVSTASRTMDSANSYRLQHRLHIGLCSSGTAGFCLKSSSQRLSPTCTYFPDS